MNILKQVCGFAISIAFVATAEAYNEMTVHFYEVGPGNCVLVNCPGAANVNLLIDCGSHSNEQKDGVIQDLIQVSQGNQTNVILSHPDKDHYNWMYEIFAFEHEFPGDDYKLLPMGTVYTGGKFSDYTNSGVSSLIQLQASNTIYGLQSIGSTANPVVAVSSTVKRPRSLPPITYTYKEVRRLDIPDFGGANPTPTNLNICGDADVRILAANSDATTWGTKTNPQSIVLSLSWAGRNFIFPGDATNGASDKALEKALKRWALVRGQPIPASFDTFNSNLKVDFMMAPHHGAETDSSNWDGWAKVTQPNHVVFSGDPSISNTSYRHPKMGGYTPYQGKLLATEAHEFRLGNNALETYRDVASGKSYSHTDSITVSEAVFPLHDTGDLKVTVYGPAAGATKGKLEVSCAVDWCNSKFFDTEPSPTDAGVTSVLSSNTKIQATVNSGVWNTNTPGEIEVTLVDNRGTPVSGVTVQFIALSGRPRLAIVSGKTSTSGKVKTQVFGTQAGSESFEAWFDSNGDEMADTRVVNGSPAQITFTTYTGGGGGGTPSGGT